jgi:Uma2 family endonuclease
MALLKARAGFYADALPTAHDVLLLIEVADTTLAYDQRIKTPLYARAGVTEVWIVDLAGEKVWVYREPSAEGYLEMKVKQQGERLSMEHRTLQLDSDGILVDDFLD